MSSIIAGSPAKTTAKNARLDYIDGLRGAAILSVLLYHTWMSLGYPVWRWWNPVSRGYIGVDLFLMLSGFCLYWPFVKKGSGASAPTLWEFAKKRARRILPPYYAALGLCVLAALAWPTHFSRTVSFPGSAQPALAAVGWHLLMLHNLNPDQLWGINAVFWSLALEVDLYVAFPLLVFIARSRGIGTAVAGAAVCTLAYRLALNHAVGGEAGWRDIGSHYAYTLCYSLPGKWLEFALGMLAAALQARRQPIPGRFLLFPAALFLILSGMDASEKWGQFFPLNDFLFAGGLFCLLLGCSSAQASATLNREQRPNVGQRVMQWPALVWLGSISYSVYLIHLPILGLGRSLLHLDSQRVSLRLTVILLLLFPVVFGVSYLFHLAFERPFMGLSKRKSPAPVPSTAISLPVPAQAEGNS